MEEQQYLDLITQASKQPPRVTRGGAITHAVFGKTMTFSLTDFTLPLLTTKKVFIRGIVEELLWILRGSTDAGELQKKNVHIWDGHSSRKHLDNTGLFHYNEGDIGPLYGFQWRHFGAEYLGKDVNYTGKGEDQLYNLIEGLTKDPHGRRHIISAWNAADLKKMALSPCHCLVQFFVEDDESLSCMLTQRSGDIGLGVPFNIASYSILTHMISNVLGRVPGKFVHVLGDAHIYEGHVDVLLGQTKLEPFKFPKLIIRNIPDDIVQRSTQEKIDCLCSLKYEDFELVGYEHHQSIKMKMVV